MLLLCSLSCFTSFANTLLEFFNQLVAERLTELFVIFVFITKLLDLFVVCELLFEECLVGFARLHVVGDAFGISHRAIINNHFGVGRKHLVFITMGDIDIMFDTNESRARRICFNTERRTAYRSNGL